MVTVPRERTWRIMRLSPRIGVAVTVAAAAAVAVGTLAATSTHAPATASHTRLTASTLPTPSHIVIVMEENHSYSDIIGNTSQAPYMNQLAGQGALMTSSYAITHPSEPNYMALFSGSTDGLTADPIPDRHRLQGSRAACPLLGGCPGIRA